MEKYYLVQEMYTDGEVVAMMKTAAQIICDLGFRDCSDIEYEVYDVSTFGKVVKLEEQADIRKPSNYHRLTNIETGNTVIEGYSPEH